MDQIALVNQQIDEGRKLLDALKTSGGIEGSTIHSLADGRRPRGARFRACAARASPAQPAHASAGP